MSTFERLTITFTTKDLQLPDRDAKKELLKIEVDLLNL